MIKDFFKIDRSMGERRVDQIAGIILLIVVFVGSILYMKYGK
jgi:hypothetical protein